MGKPSLFLLGGDGCGVVRIARGGEGRGHRPPRSIGLVFLEGSHGGGTSVLGGGGAFTRIGDHGIGEADGGGQSHGVFGDRGGR